MSDDDEISLHSAKSLIRRLKTATDRLSRNNLLSSICSDELKDVEMKSNHSEENYFQDDEMNDIIMQDSDEEQPKISSITFDYPADVGPDVNSYSSNDDNENEISPQIVHDVASNNSQSSPRNTKQISIALALFRHRHNLSKSLCDLLRSLGVQNVPADFRSIERNVVENQDTVLQGKKYTICSKCDNKGIVSSKCENVECSSSAGFKSTPTTLCTFKLLPQIISILERHCIMPETDYNEPRIITDVQEGQIRRNLIHQERMLNPNKQIITFLLNSDGVVSIGSNKPKKNLFQNFIDNWANELRQLELGFYISFPNSNGTFVKVFAYLIAAALDKPAQALLMNINDPTGFYSCIRCTIRGKMKTSKLKSNEADPACGQRGQCVLRDLSYFNIGQSFTSDSLHNIYSGIFKRLLELWFRSRREPYSIHNSLHLIEEKLDSIRYPSTTYRLPSQLKYFQTYKGNEYRVTLLFGYQ
ncbi:unnamed protein product [Rotaria sordida]|uniref:Uncharacterized protein n=1 Tax=Rotaria sordida TaxID=392033 RepID=A0A819RZU1_9BILA|nr:unnamed protein product [Rotaria sordida]